MFKEVEMRTAQDNQDIIYALEKEIAEKNVRILELEGKLKASERTGLYISKCALEGVAELEKLEKQNARMRECLCRIIEFENCENHFMTYVSSVAIKTLEELEGKE